MLHALSSPVPVILVGQQDQPGRAPRSAYGFEEDLRLGRERARVGIVVAVDDQDRLIDLVGEEGGRDLDVLFGCLGLRRSC